MNRLRLSKENALLLANDVFVRETLDLKSWDLRRMNSNVLQMKKIFRNTRWEKSELTLRNKLARSLDELERVIFKKDATLVDAAHTHVEVVLAELREHVFGV
jgi:hypothetical protein